VGIWQHGRALAGGAGQPAGPVDEGRDRCWVEPAGATTLLGFEAGYARPENDRKGLLSQASLASAGCPWSNSPVPSGVEAV
jgi:hypothetical protein